ncbi:UDP-galactopyranose mutase [Dyadobacter sp. CECT 9275]|uniref:UDP-galactopyranose mutase n=1 Tax=Dyadobacter helix TaxID=2822344 RepID=A0A916JIC1_9BACT|nr:FAD-dependent oxidoreductase [Dyadobacter sp. CECT 9275]CAG5018008.1 UDP-galactopyranose mutase [Dyadobacter sp. CECT 9275]
MKVDYLIIGSGLTGATIARHLADNNREVMVIDRRTHGGGNVHDEIHPSGIPMHTYGPHYFRTNSDELWAYVNRFGSFYRFEAQVRSWVDNAYEQWPVDEAYIRKAVGMAWQPAHRGIARNFEEASLAMMPRVIYEKFVKGYSEKQWGVPAHLLSADLARRFDVRSDDAPRFSRHKHQGLPTDGYANWMANMLKGIPTKLNVDYLKNREVFRARRMLVFTGPIDEFFGFRLGKLQYRGQVRTHQYLPNVDYAHPCPQVNNPQLHNGLHIRTLEWKHMLPSHISRQISGTLLTREKTITPTLPDHYEYPFPDAENRALFKQYAQLAEREADTLICGRLGEYRYYDMDQAISRARMLAAKILVH